MGCKNRHSFFEAKLKKMGTCQWIYRGLSLDTAMELVKEAKEKYREAQSSKNEKLYNKR